MNILTGNMLSIVGSSDYVFFTSNSTPTSNNRLVMGKGIAQQFKNLLPNLPEVLGKKLYEANLFCKLFGIMDSGLKVGRSNIWAFQTKTLFRFDSTPTILELSISMLKEIAENCPELRFDLNYPAIGLGGMNINTVLPMISVLPDNVNIWQKG